MSEMFQQFDHFAENFVTLYSALLGVGIAALRIYIPIKHVKPSITDNWPVPLFFEHLGEFSDNFLIEISHLTVRKNLGIERQKI